MDAANGISEAGSVLFYCLRDKEIINIQQNSFVIIFCKPGR